MKKKFEFSKIILVFFSILYVWVLWNVFNYDFGKTNYGDIASIGICVTVTGGILGSAVVNYYKKAQMENIQKIQKNTYQEMTNIRLNYNKEMMLYKKTYDISDDEVSQIDSQSGIGESCDSVWTNTDAQINDAICDANSETNIQNY